MDGGGRQTSADLDAEARRAFEARAVPVPEAVTRGVVRYVDKRRFEVPVTVVCPEFSAVQAREWVDSGQLPEVARARRVDYVDIDSGHWPMFTRPAELSRLLAETARPSFVRAHALIEPVIAHNAAARLRVGGFSAPHRRSPGIPSELGQHHIWVTRAGRS